MQEPRSTSTLELVVNESQLQNMSQIDLTRPNENNNQNEPQQTGFSFKQFKNWPSRFRENFSAKMDEAKSKSNTNTEFIIQVIQAFSGTAIWILCFFCTIIVPVLLFLIGLINLDNCSDRPSLPYLVFATGFTMTASNLFNLALALDLPVLTNHQILSSDIKNTIASIMNIIFNCVVAFLYIICCYMIYTFGGQRRTVVKEGNEETGSEQEELIMNCSGTLYYFTFWFLTLTLALFMLLSVVASIFFAYNKYRMAIIRGSTPRSQPNNVSTNPSSSL